MYYSLQDLTGELQFSNYDSIETALLPQLSYQSTE